MMPIFWIFVFPVILGWWVARRVWRRYGTAHPRTVQVLVFIAMIALVLAAFQAMILHNGAILSPARNLHAFGPDGAMDEIWAQFFVVYPLTLLGVGLSRLRRKQSTDPNAFLARKAQRHHR